MKVCVVGSGGREHALADVLARTTEVTVAPGNAGMALAGLATTSEPPEAVEADLFVIGPEAPLVDGLADLLRAQGRLVFGPGADGARLEGSKAWMKQVLADAGVPTATYGSFTEIEPARAHLEGMAGLYVIKTDGLAAGKGVLVTESLAEARDAVASYLSGEAFGDAGRRVVIEEGLTGPELSLLAVCDGRRAIPLAPAQDFKRIGDGDAGPNTGGMGAYSPVPAVGPDLVGQIMDEAVEPTLARLRSLDIDYRGVLYAGLMLTPDGPKVLEYNIRFGDPEAQVVLPRFESDLAELLLGAASGSIGHPPTFRSDAAVTVVLATEGYPTSTRTGDVIDGLAPDGSLPDALVFFAGVDGGERGELRTAGGRVLDITAFGSTIDEARARAYTAVDRVSWPGMQFRRDIAVQPTEEVTT
jgi:phosphoribosylamine--glycine ligase